MASISQRTSQDIQFSAAQLPVQVTSMKSMASKMWVPFIAMGFMIVMAAFIYGLVNSANTSDYFQFSKETREAAAAGSSLAIKITPQTGNTAMNIQAGLNLHRFTD